MRNVRVNRSVIGQQPALSSNDAPTLNNTLAPPGRERGTGEVAGDITIQEATVQASSESNNETEVSRVGTPSSTPTRRVAPNDGRRGRNTRPRNHNMRFTLHILHIFHCQQEMAGPSIWSGWSMGTTLLRIP